MLSCVILAIIASLLAVVGPLITWAYSDGNWVITLAVAGVIAGTIVLSVLALWKLGIERFLKYGIEVLLIGVVVFMVVALAGCPSWTWTVMECAVALAVVFWVLRMLEEGKITYVKTPLNILLLLLIVVIFFQLVPMPAGLLRHIQSNTLRCHTVGPPNVAAVMNAELPTGGSYPISLCRARTRGHLFLYMAYVGFFLVFINNVTSREQLGRMLGALLAMGAFLAVAGFATTRQEGSLFYRRWPVGSGGEAPGVLNRDANPELSAGYGFWHGVQEAPLKRAEEQKPEAGPGVAGTTGRAAGPAGTREEAERRARVDWYVAKAYGGDVFGGFSRRASAATTMVMLLCMSFGVVFAYLRTRRAEWGRSGGLLYTHEGNIMLLVIFSALLLIAGVVRSGSRGGIAVMLIAVPMLTVLIAFTRHWLAGIIALVLSPVVVVVLVVLILLGTTLVTGSIGELVSAEMWLEPLNYLDAKAGLSLNPWEGDVRMIGRSASWKMFTHFRTFGTGLGTFANVYPNYLRTGPMLYFAHCDSVQWLAEMGLVGGVLAILIVTVGVWTVIAGLFRLRDAFFRVLLVGCAMACLVFFGHGLVDFPLQVPAVTTIFVALAGVCVILGNDQIARHEEEDFIF